LDERTILASNVGTREYRYDTNIPVWAPESSKPAMPLEWYLCMLLV
jgi:hypothetical protein